MSTSSCTDGLSGAFSVAFSEREFGEFLKRMLESWGHAYSHATGEFSDKAVAVSGRRRRVEFLVCGLRWARRKFDRALPETAQPEMRATIRSMSDSHTRGI